MVMGIVRTQYSNIGYGLLRLLLLLFLKEKEELERYFVLPRLKRRTNDRAFKGPFFASLLILLFLSEKVEEGKRTSPPLPTFYFL